MTLSSEIHSHLVFLSFSLLLVSLWTHVCVLPASFPLCHNRPTLCSTVSSLFPSCTLTQHGNPPVSAYPPKPHTHKHTRSLAVPMETRTNRKHAGPYLEPRGSMQGVSRLLIPQCMRASRLSEHAHARTRTLIYCSNCQQKTRSTKTGLRFQTT